ncbi:MAG TPA: D-alanine--D-alanine ligase [bacterium]|nr:D-alanine--D-alanine ligase [bacterium]
MKKKKRIAVLYGGKSSEREISLRTGRSIYGELKKAGHKVFLLDSAEKWWKHIPDLAPDMVFISLHGPGGEDGSVQGLLEVMGIPYTGSGILASALALDKLKSREIFERHGIRVPEYRVYDGRVKGRRAFIPGVVKPVDQGSTVGTALVESVKEFRAALRRAKKFSRTVLAEKYIKGREFTVGILGNRALPVLEIVPLTGYYDWEAKYRKGMSKHICPAPLEKRETSELQALALKAHRLLGCRAYSRVDFLRDRKGLFYLLEVNTIPGMTSTSLFPEAASVLGLGFGDVLERIMEASLSES